METVKKSFPTRGNKSTEIIIGAAATKLTSAVKAMSEAVQQVSTLETKVQEGTLKVTDLEDKIGGLEQDFKNKSAQNKIDLQQAFDADKVAFVGKYLAENQLSTIRTMELNDLNNRLVEATDKVENTVNAAVSKAVGIEKSNSANALKLAQLEHEKKEASNTAEIAQLKLQITFLEKQCASWEKALDAERLAQTERAKASAVGTISVGGTTQGR